MAREFRTRTLGVLLACAAGFGLIGCGGGREDAARPAPVAAKFVVGPAPLLPPTTLPLHIEGMYITQRSQRRDQSVPLVKGQAGVLRVFVTADHWDGPGPAVEVRIVSQGGTVHTERIEPPGDRVPQILNEAVLADSWNLRLPGNQIQPGNAVQVRLLAPVGVRTGNLEYPEDGTALPMNVVEVAPFRIALVPVSSGGQVGQVLGGGRTAASWVEALRQQFPLGEIRVRVADVFHTTQAVDDDHGLNALLGELEALRQADRGPDDEYFYGVYPTRYGTRQPRGRAYTKVHPDRVERSAIGCDITGQRPGFNYMDILAHEIGHNLGLRHAPCGKPQWPLHVDPRFPYGEGGIGACGFDVVAWKTKDPTVYKDLMSYCEPTWCSDYGCRAVLAFRAGEAVEPSRPAGDQDQDGLLVQGLLDQGRVSLQPAFQVRRPPLTPESGEYVLSALDSAGRVLERVPFAILTDEDDPEGDAEGSFTFVLPLTRAQLDSLALLRVTQDGAVLAELRSSAHGPRTGQVAGGGERFHPRAGRDSHGRVHLRWDSGSYPEAMVKDARTGHVLALGPGGRLDLASRAQSLVCLFSDGLHTLVRRLPVGP